MKHDMTPLLRKTIVSSIFAIQFWGGIAPADSVAPGAVKVSPPTSQPGVSVRIDNFRFSPAAIDIPAGTTVTWLNADDVPHTATSKDIPQRFDSGAMDTDGKFSFRFTRPGKFTYYCKVHPHMTGVITVK